MENLNSCEFLEGLSCYQPFEHITCHLTTFRRPNWPIVSLLFMNGNGWREAAFIVYFSHDIDTWFVNIYTFGSQQESALQDYLEASVMLRYNNAKRV